jgi:hypothetical protein
MSKVIEKIQFAFYLNAKEQVGYTRRHWFIAELCFIPGIQVSAVDFAAGSDGSEIWLITISILSSMANVATIVDFLHKYLRKKRKKTENREVLTFSLDEEGEETLSNMTKEELTKAIITRGSYSTWGKSLQKKTRNRNIARKKEIRN